MFELSGERPDRGQWLGFGQEKSRIGSAHLPWFAAVVGPAGSCEACQTAWARAGRPWGTALGSGRWSGAEDAILGAVQSCLLNTGQNMLTRRRDASWIPAGL